MPESLREDRTHVVTGARLQRTPHQVFCQSVAYRTRWTRPLRGVALAVTTGLAAAACTSAPASTTSTTNAGAVAASAPAVTMTQARHAFDSYVAASDTAARTGDATLALSGVSGVQWAQVHSQYKAYGYYHLRPPYTRAAYGTPTLYLPAPGGYPRWFVADVSRTLTQPAPAVVSTPAITGEPAGSGRVLMLFEQTSATATWQLASTSELPQGVSPPSLAVNKDGQVPTLAVSQSTGLLARPDVVGPLLGAVVDDGPSAPAARVVSTGPLTTGLYQTAGAAISTPTPRGDVHQWNLDGSNYTQFALRTADGGALVFFAMFLNNTIAVPAELDNSEPVNPGPPIAVPANLVPLLPAGTTAARLKLERQDLLSFAAVDPPAGNGSGKIQVIAAGGGLNYASAS